MTIIFLKKRQVPYQCGHYDKSHRNHGVDFQRVVFYELYHVVESVLFILIMQNYGWCVKIQMPNSMQICTISIVDELLVLYFTKKHVLLHMFWFLYDYAVKPFNLD